MSTITEKVSTVMLTALLKNAKKYSCDIRSITISLSLNDDGELVCTVMMGLTGKCQPSLSELIGFMYAAAGKGRIKKALRDLEKEMHVAPVSVFIQSEDGKTISVKAVGGKQTKQLTIDQLL